MTCLSDLRVEDFFEETIYTIEEGKVITKEITVNTIIGLCIMVKNGVSRDLILHNKFTTSGEAQAFIDGDKTYLDKMNDIPAGNMWSPGGGLVE